MDRQLVRACLLAAWLAPGAGCSLVLDFDKSLADASLDGSARCSANEPNEALDTASPLTPGTYDLGICSPADKDFFSFSTTAGDEVVITMTHPDAGQAGDLDLRLFAAGNTTAFDSSVGAGTQEQISRTSTEGNVLVEGAYVIGVEGFNGSTNDYTLTLTITAAPTPDAGADGGIDAAP